MPKPFTQPPAMPGEVVLEARSLQVVRADTQLLTDVSLQLHAGEVLALIGPNGAGKSTLLSVLSGDLPSEGGDIVFRGRPLGDWSLVELARMRSVLLQQNQIMFPFTVHQVVEMGRAPWRRTPREDDDTEAIAEALEAADVAHLADRRVTSLSGGERARVEFARVMAGRTGVLMLDEPTAALDLSHQEALLRIARARAESGDAVLIILHDLNLATAFADRVALLQRGHLVACDTPARVLTAERLTEVYGTPVEVIKHPGSGASIVLPLRD